MVNFLFAIIENVSPALTVETYKQILVEVAVFQIGVGQFKRTFQVEGDIAHQPLLVGPYHKTRLITLSCSVKISAVLSVRHKARVWQTDRQTLTDRIKIPKTALA